MARQMSWGSGRGRGGLLPRAEQVGQCWGPWGKDRPSLMPHHPLGGHGPLPAPPLAGASLQQALCASLLPSPCSGGVGILAYLQVYFKDHKIMNVEVF